MTATAKYKTRSSVIPHRDLEVENGSHSPIIGLDIGYSAVKGYTRDRMVIFPSFAYPAVNLSKLLVDGNENDILYHDNLSGTDWYVGSAAQDQLGDSNTNVSESQLYARSRYYSDEFRILFETGVALSFGGREVPGDFIFQTGLPPKYRKEDTPMLKDALAGEHDFTLKIGRHDVINYRFTLTEDRIFIMDQPMGTLSNFMNASSMFLLQTGMVIDIGFGTLDVCEIRGNRAVPLDTFNNLGMHAVFSKAADMIMEKHGKMISTISMQKYLEDGKFPVIKRGRTSISRDYQDLTPFISEATHEIAQEALRKIFASYPVEDYHYIILTGGTGEAFFEEFQNAFIGMPETQIILASSIDDETPNTFANARGYYVFRSRAEASKKKCAVA